MSYSSEGKAWSRSAYGLECPFIMKNNCRNFLASFICQRRRKMPSERRRRNIGSMQIAFRGSLTGGDSRARTCDLTDVNRALWPAELCSPICDKNFICRPAVRRLSNAESSALFYYSMYFLARQHFSQNSLKIGALMKPNYLNPSISSKYPIYNLSLVIRLKMTIINKYKIDESR